MDEPRQPLEIYRSMLRAAGVSEAMLRAIEGEVTEKQYVLLLTPYEAANLMQLVRAVYIPGDPSLPPKETRSTASTAATGSANCTGSCEPRSARTTPSRLTRSTSLR